MRIEVRGRREEEVVRMNEEGTPMRKVAKGGERGKKEGGGGRREAEK